MHIIINNENGSIRPTLGSYELKLCTLLMYCITVGQHRIVVYTCCRDGKYRGNTNIRTSSQKGYLRKAVNLGQIYFVWQI